MKSLKILGIGLLSISTLLMLNRVSHAENSIFLLMNQSDNGLENLRPALNYKIKIQNGMN